jgi:hypothetical protein
MPLGSCHRQTIVFHRPTLSENLQPERIDQIILDERLNEICASINVQIWPFLLLDFGDFFRNILADKWVRRSTIFLPIYTE